ncbi:MalY/PatB family protein [Paenarthrobacter sp. NPDC056912]|uniref:MalY/PatB family protein n=1 Tax=Paenarthrobacter sp. NPDC056912 TaxID=3345965 RepID=UPI00367013A5
MTTVHDFDEISIEQLRGVGGFKWSLYPEKIGAFVAEMDFGVAPSITEAVNSAVEQGLFGYLPQHLGEAMSRACSTWQESRYGWKVPMERIRPLADVLTALTATIQHFSPAGSKVIVLTPAYTPFLKIPRLCGREIIEVAMKQTPDGWDLDYEGLDEAFAGGGGLLIMCNPHNPIGKVYTRQEMLKVAKIVDSHNGRVFSDEIHAPLVYGDNRHVPYASISPVASGHTITATSGSKAWNLAGLKAAQLIISNDADAAKWMDLRFFPEHGTCNLGVVANTAAYATGSEWLADVLNYLDGNRRLLAELVTEHLPGVCYSIPQGTYLALLDCRALEMDEAPGEFFSEHAGVQLIDGSACGEAGKGFVRLNFATPRPILTKMLERMGASLAARDRIEAVSR